MSIAAGPYSRLWRLFDGPSKLVSQQLHAVANAKQGNSELEYFRIGQRSAFVMHARWSSGEDNSLGLEVFDRLQAHIEGMDLTEDVAFPNPAGNQLGGLGAEIEDQYPFLV